MKNKFILIFIVILLSVRLNAQEYNQTNSGKISIQENIYRFNLSMQGFYFSYEKRLSSSISLYSDLGLGAVFGWNIDMGYRWAISPTLSTEARWYFNYKKRYEAGKKLLFNAADFLSFQLGYLFKPIDRQTAYINSAYFFIPNIGMQRTWGKHINFELKFGLGFMYSDEYNEGGFGYKLNLKFGYIFNKVK